MKFELIYTKTKSTFSLQYTDLQEDDEKNISLVGMSFDEFYYQDRESKFYFSEFLGDYYKVDQSKDDFEWKIKNKTKKILGYTCKKALGDNGKEEVVVWFTTELPYSYGPYGNNGLPGIVLESITKTKHFYAIKVEKNTHCHFPKIIKSYYTKFTTEEYNDHIELMVKKMMNR